MNKSLTFLAATSAFALLSACGGSAPGHIPENYVPINQTASKTSTLGGVSARVNSTNPRMDILTTSGTLNHFTGATTVTDGTYTLADPDGLDANNELSDGTVTLEVSTSTNNSSYEYLIVYTGEYEDNGQEYTTSGVGGIITSATDVAASTSATYTGESGFFVADGPTNYGMTGTAQVSADFSGGTVDVTMDVLTAEETTFGSPVVPVIDRFEVNDMTIQGNVFTGGTLTTTKGGNPVDITGGPIRTEARGAFFGYDNAASAPDEVGGMIFQDGPDGFILGTFLAD